LLAASFSQIHSVYKNNLSVITSSKKITHKQN